MARLYQGAHEANIPIDDILRDYAAWATELVEAVGKELLLEVKAEASLAFDDKTGNLRKSIARKRSKFDRETHIVGAFAPHAHLVEFGHIMLTKDGKPTVKDHVPGRLFLTKAEKSIRARLKEIVESVAEPTIEVKR